MSIAFHSSFPFDYLLYDYLTKLPKEITSGNIRIVYSEGWTSSVFRSFNFNNAWPSSVISSG